MFTITFSNFDVKEVSLLFLLKFDVFKGVVILHRFTAELLFLGLTEILLKMISYKLKSPIIQFFNCLKEYIIFIYIYFNTKLYIIQLLIMNKSYLYSSYKK